MYGEDGGIDKKDRGKDAADVGRRSLRRRRI